MHDMPAARQVARRFVAGFAARFAIAAAVILAAFCFSPLAAFAVTGARSPPGAATPPTPSGSLPGLQVPAPRPTPPDVDRTDGTTASGPVRAQPAHMPFYVATKGQVTIYLLGTLHVGYADDYPASLPFRKPILGALDASPVLALEISPDDLLVSQEEVSKFGTCRSQCLSRYLPDALWKKLETRMRGNPTMLDDISRSRPWLASMLVETVDTLKAGFLAEYGSETQLQNVYLRPRGRVVGLETLSEQISAFTRLTQAQQREMLAQDLVQTPAENIADVKELHRLWRIGDADALKAWDDAKTEKLARSKTLAAQIDNRVVYDRNYRFVARMVALAAPNKPVFVAIGALHLGGERGVLALLRRRGFIVEPA
jgi:uncharacterized protein YbaP (TraB family)